MWPFLLTHLTWAEPQAQQTVPQEDVPSPTELIARAPLERLAQVYVNGFHYAAEDPTEQMEANHYCEVVESDFIACVVHDADGRLSGVEHIIGRERFERLPEEEQRLWHPHNYEVKSGLLIAPGLSAAKEQVLMEALVSTYGKTWDVYPEHPATLPTGRARLMKGFTADGQIQLELIEERDRRFGVSVDQLRRRREAIEDPGFNPIVLEVGPPPRT